ncbi:MAG: EAL domain-containing protein [Magnetococcus sp. DMHC-1]|nr:EAL domain-containing protein [Magnetococcales bacterium]
MSKFVVKSVKTKFISLFLFMLLLTLSGSALVSFKVTEDAMVESALAAMDNVNLELAHRAATFHNKARSDLLLSVENEVFKEYFSHPDFLAGVRRDAKGVIQFSEAQKSLRNRINSWLLSLQKRLPIVESCLIDRTGQEHTRVTYGKIALDEDYSDRENTLPFFQSAMNLRAGEVHIQYPYMSPEAKKWVFAYVTPIILENGEKPGILHYELPVSLFQDLLRGGDIHDRSEQDRSRLLILDPAGLIVADSRQKISLDQRSDAVVGKEDPLASSLPNVSTIDTSERFQALFARIRQGETGSGWFEAQGERQFMVFRPLTTFGWSVVHMRPYHALLQGKRSLNELRFYFALAAILSLLVAAGVIWYFSRRITEPLHSLTGFARKIASGNLDFTMRVREETQDELGLLARTFNQMVETLARTTDSKEFTEGVLMGMVDGLLVLDIENKIHRLNPAILEILGESESGLMGRHFDQLLPDPVFAAEMFRDLLAGNPVRARESVFATTDRRVVPVAISSSLLHKENGAIAGVVILVQNISQRKADEERLYFLANYDPLTGLPNRILMQERLGQALTRIPWRKKRLGVMFCDLDRFKIINDTLGHRAGDELLKTTASRLLTCVRDGDTVARLGGDEFVILLQDVEKQEDIVQIADKIIQAVSRPMILEKGGEVVVTTSIGISFSPDDGNTEEILLKNADIAMYHAKDEGKNKYCCYSADLHKKSSTRLGLEADLRRAVEQGGFLVYYQPRLDLGRGRIMGAEALVRWQHPERGIVPPGDFLSLAEELGVIEEIDRWVLKEACRQNRVWRRQGFPAIRISVNMSHRLFRTPGLVQVVAQMLDDHELEADALELELTESIAMDEISNSIQILQSLRKMWIHLAVDDFGTGYSSFAHLRKLPVHVLKIDRSFIRDIAADTQDAAIAKAIIDMGHTLNLRITAEGVETEDQLRILTAQGCDEIQGYLISRPVMAADFEKLFHLSHPPRKI